MAVDFGLTRKLAGFGRDAGKMASDWAGSVIADARKPGPEMKVDHFGPNDVSTASGLIRVGTSLLAGSRRRANMDLETRKTALNQTYMEAQTNRLNAAAESDRDAIGRPRPFNEQRKGESDKDYVTRQGTLDAARDAAAAKTYDTKVNGKTFPLNARDAAAQESRNVDDARQQKNAERALTTQQAIAAQAGRLAEIDRAAGEKGIVNTAIDASVRSEAESLLQRITQPGAPRFDKATANQALSVVGMGPRGGRTPGDDAKLEKAIKAWTLGEIHNRRARATDSLLTERRYTVEALRSLSSGMSPEKAAFEAILEGFKGGAPADTTTVRR